LIATPVTPINGYRQRVAAEQIDGPQPGPPVGSAIIGCMGVHSRTANVMAKSGNDGSARAAGRRVTILAALVLCGCTPPPIEPQPSTPRVERARIVSVTGLDAPQIGLERVFAPQREYALATGDATIPLIGFYMRVSVESPDRLRLRCVDVLDGEVLPDVRIDQPGRSTSIDAAINLLDDAARARLRDGKGLYWIEAASAGGGDSRMGVLLPEKKLAARTRLEVYTSTTTGGDPTGSDRIELARGFFYMAVLGDSAMWGNGLLEEDKFSYLTARRIERALNVRVIRDVRAVSGGTIVPHDEDGLCTTNCSGEYPQYFTSITLQAQALGSPELFDLVLLDGCGNDISLEATLTSVDNTKLIRERGDAFCFAEMANLLIRVRALAPDTPIVVTGYFPFLSLNSDLSEVGTWAVSNDIDLGPIDDLEPALQAFVDNSQAFHDATSSGLAAAVELVAGLDDGDPPIAYVDPGFGPENATFARDAWLWGLTDDLTIARQLDITLDLFPEDPVLDERIDNCARPDVAPNFIACVYASVGHPNPTGARAYADAIATALVDIGLLPETSADR
jgi:lysophospholipase L1-like esterase